jgi:hypothetical protein
MPERILVTCSVCRKNYSQRVDGNIRHHVGQRKQGLPFGDDCPGGGQPPWNPPVPYPADAGGMDPFEAADDEYQRWGS